LGDAPKIMALFGAAWRHSKLMEVSVSPDARNPYADGHVRLVSAGCRDAETRSLIGRQPRRSSVRPTDVWMEFEAFMLAADYSQQRSRPSGPGQQWIHTTVLACVDARDCRPVRPAKLVNDTWILFRVD